MGLLEDVAWLGPPRWTVATDLVVGATTSSSLLCVAAGRAVEVPGSRGNEREQTSRRTSVREWVAELLAAVQGIVAPAQLSVPPSEVTGLICDSELLLTSSRACAEHRSDLLAALIAESGVIHRRRGRVWGQVHGDEAARLIERVHRDRIASLRLRVQDCVGDAQLTLAWLAFPDGWWEVAAGAPGRTRVQRRNPDVVGQRLRWLVGDGR